jgi:hypothetical protein
MTTSEFNARIDAMMERIAALPETERGALEGLVTETRARYDVARQAFGQIQDAVADLQLNLKYMKFDVEATRREMAAIRDMALGEENQDETDTGEHC